MSNYFPHLLIYMIDSLCAPALVFIAFSLTQIIIDMYKSMYNTALVKMTVMVVFTIILNVLCQRGMGVVAWIIVFIPFIMMSVITVLLLTFFGLAPTVGSAKPDNDGRPWPGHGHRHLDTGHGHRPGHGPGHGPGHRPWPGPGHRWTWTWTDTQTWT